MQRLSSHLSVPSQVRVLRKAALVVLALGSTHTTAWANEAACGTVESGSYIHGKDRYFVSDRLYAPNIDLSEAIKQEYGNDAEVADWLELKSILLSPREIGIFEQSMHLKIQSDRQDCDNYYVSVRGALTYKGLRFLLARHDGRRPFDWTALDQIGQKNLELGRWTHWAHAIVKTSLQVATSEPDSDKLSGDANVIVPARNEASLEKRVALVVGNSNYQSVAALANPRLDADSVAVALRGLGFDVIEATDVTHQQFVEALQTFEAKVTGSEWALVYFAGHGIEANGQNFLIPIDAKLEVESRATDEAISLERIESAVQGASRLRLVLLDACRSNPFLSRMRRIGNVTRAVDRGLKPVEPDAGTLIVYATRAGNIAEDGVGAHSPFATAFLREIRRPKLEVRRLFDYVRDDVLAATDQSQQPYTYGSLPASKDFYFQPTSK